MSTDKLACESWSDEDMRAELWAGFIQRGWNGLPTDKDLRDMLWAGLDIAINKWVVAQNTIDRMRKDAKNADDTAKSLRAALADNNDTRQMQLNRAAELLALIVGESMTHGQKNGAILLVVATLRKMSQDDLYLGNIPF